MEISFRKRTNLTYFVIENKWSFKFKFINIYLHDLLTKSFIVCNNPSPRTGIKVSLLITFQFFYQRQRPSHNVTNVLSLYIEVDYKQVKLLYTMFKSFFAVTILQIFLVTRLSQLEICVFRVRAIRCSSTEAYVK